MTGHVNVSRSVVNNLGAFFGKLIYHVGHELFVTGNGVGGHNNQVICRYFNLSVVVICHTVQCAHRLALTAGGYYNKLVRLIPLYVVNVYENVVI